MAMTGIDLIQGTAFNVAVGSTTGSVGVTTKNALPGDKILNVFVFAPHSGPPQLAADVTSQFGTNLVGDVPGNPPRIVCYNNNFGSIGLLSDVLVLVSIATTGTSP